MEVISMFMQIIYVGVLLMYLIGAGLLINCLWMAIKRAVTKQPTPYPIFAQVIVSVLIFAIAYGVNCLVI